ncbi:Lipid-A-disaccharide synthase [hydrothermal vent metagenome]|uniref:lipid-A-disaccharide synthase n=1 Tax=hydrothermal vent metagenome TaxID=652676 RepID=A0A3B0V4Y7_9ZZZZ
MSKKIFIISGEASGDLHGSSLISELKKLIPGVSFAGMGGPLMHSEGLTGLDSSAIAVVGIIEVAKKFGDIKKAFRRLQRMLEKDSFDCVVLVDYPDFNLRFAAKAKKLGVPIVYYISPQVWAWRKKRINKIAALVDKMLVVFPFEEELYRKAGVDVEHVGHPLTKEAVCTLSKEEAARKLGVADDEAAMTVAILPGSRSEEVERHLTPMIEAVELVQKRLKTRLNILLPAARSLEARVIEEAVKGAASRIRIVRGETYPALRAADAALIASGTATLEAALIGTPMVIIYKLSGATFFIGRRLIGIKNVGLPNIVAGKTIVTELIQDKATPENIADELTALLTGKDRRALMQREFKEIRKRLGDGSAAARAAAAIARVLDA